MRIIGKRLGLLFSIYFISSVIYAQKPSIDTSTLALLSSKWSHLSEGYKISPNGNYVFYGVINTPSPGLRIWYLKAVNDSSDLHTFLDCEGGDFAPDGKKIIIKIGDTLLIWRLGTSNPQRFFNVTDYKLFADFDHSWLAISRASPEKELIIMNLKNGKKQTYTGVEYYWPVPKRKGILIETTELSGKHTLLWTLLASGQSTRIWEGPEVNNIVIDDQENKIAFFTQEKKQGNSRIFIYNVTEPSATEVVNDTSFITKGFHLTGSRMRFSKDGNTLFFVLEKHNDKSSVKNLQNQANVSIWNYKDEILQSEQKNQKIRPGLYARNNFTANINLTTGKVNILEDQKIGLIGEYYSASNNHYSLAQSKGSPDAYYNKLNRPYLYLIDIRDGSNTMLAGPAIFGLFGNNTEMISPDEKHVIWFDRDSLSYYSYEIANNVKHNLSSKIIRYLYDEETAKVGKISPWGIAGWIKNENTILIYDQYDIWKVDLDGINPSINLTNGFGRRHHIIFSVVNLQEYSVAPVFEDKQPLLLSAYDEVTKENGYANSTIPNPKDPVIYKLDPSASFVPRVGRTGINIAKAVGSPPIKAQNKRAFLTVREDASSSPNLFVTTNFKDFHQVSDVHPEKKYNWLTSELINWKMKDGRTSQGILYKPENFDSTKKYPIIFFYYEKRSDALHEFVEPNWSNATINIPFYVSNGYLVFTPDIPYTTPGHDGEELINAVASAAEYLASFHWVAANKMGLQGHSFGGWETNYLVTHTNSFAAACEASGVSDEISAYDQIAAPGRGSYDQGYYESTGAGSPYGIGVTPWIQPRLYLANSPVLHIREVTTPLLIMHGTLDAGVPFSQAIEMFLALKRAAKPVWLLEYEKEGHGLGEEADVRDFTIRMKQFFDHYLKGEPPPKWMTTGVPASAKEVETGYKLEPNESCSENCPVCSKKIYSSN